MVLYATIPRPIFSHFDALDCRGACKRYPGMAQTVRMLSYDIDYSGLALNKVHDLHMNTNTHKSIAPAYGPSYSEVALTYGASFCGIR